MEPVVNNIDNIYVQNHVAANPLRPIGEGVNLFPHIQEINVTLFDDPIDELCSCFDSERDVISADDPGLAPRTTAATNTRSTLAELVEASLKDVPLDHDVIDFVAEDCAEDSQREQAARISTLPVEQEAVVNEMLVQQGSLVSKAAAEAATLPTGLAALLLPPSVPAYTVPQVPSMTPPSIYKALASVPVHVPSAPLQLDVNNFLAHLREVEEMKMRAAVAVPDSAAPFQLMALTLPHFETIDVTEVSVEAAGIAVSAAADAARLLLQKDPIGHKPAQRPINLLPMMREPVTTAAKIVLPSISSRTATPRAMEAVIEQLAAPIAAVAKPVAAPKVAVVEPVPAPVSKSAVTEALLQDAALLFPAANNNARLKRPAEESLDEVLIYFNNNLDQDQGEFRTPSKKRMRNTMPNPCIISSPAVMPVALDGAFLRAAAAAAPNAPPPPFTALPGLLNANFTMDAESKMNPWYTAALEGLASGPKREWDEIMKEYALPDLAAIDAALLDVPSEATVAAAAATAAAVAAVTLSQFPAGYVINKPAAMNVDTNDMEMEYYNRAVVTDEDIALEREFAGDEPLLQQRKKKQKQQTQNQNSYNKETGSIKVKGRKISKKG